MTSRQISPGVYSVGAIDWDRRLFDELIPLPEGTSYNAYLLKGSHKTALIDTVYAPKEKELVSNLNELKTDRIDYVVTNHAEEDHSGSLPAILELYPEAKAVTNEKCRSFLEALMRLPGDRFMTVEDGSQLPLGDKTLQFMIAPWVHWPETMFTYLKEDSIIFTCDFFGSHLATTELYADRAGDIYRSAKRYYAEIMMPFRAAVRNNLEKVSKLGVDIIAPSHGPIYRKPEFIMNAYREWSSDDVKNEVVIAYVSMYGSTGEMVRYLFEALMKKGVVVRPFNLPATDVGELAMALVDAATIVVGAPTVLAGPHPSAVYAAYLVKALRPKARFATIVGSYLWGGKMPEDVKNIIGGLKLELLDPVISRGDPREQELRQLDNLAETIRQKHEAIGVLQ